MTIEGKPFYGVDIYAIANGRYNAITLQTAQMIVDGFVTISLSKNDTTSVDNPKISGIEIKHLAPHTAHSVSGGPYQAVDILNKGYVLVSVNGGESHTHGQNLVLNQWIWKEGAKVLGTGVTANLNLTVGEHSVVLTVVDSGGNDSSETFAVSVMPFGFPAVVSTSPSNGTINGNQLVTISGSGFNFTADQTIVNFGLVNLTGSAIQIKNSTTITVLSPRAIVATPVMISVTTPKGRSAAVPFTYVAASPIAFDSAKLLDLASATVARFGPDEKLYVGTLYGQLAKITMNANFTAVVSTTVATVCNYKAILGIAFDPMDAGNLNPPVYISSSFFFHGESNNTFGEAINGKVLRVTGANLDVVQSIVTGLPVSDADHGMFLTHLTSMLCIF
jgi:IPT/TIG domain